MVSREYRPGLQRSQSDEDQRVPLSKRIGSSEEREAWLAPVEGVPGYLRGSLDEWAVAAFSWVSQEAPIKATLLSLERELRIRVSRPSFEGGDFILPSDETEALDTIDALLRRPGG